MFRKVHSTLLAHPLSRSQALEDGLHPGTGRLAVLRVDVILNLVVAVGVSFSVVGVLDVGHCVEMLMNLCKQYHRGGCCCYYYY